MEYTTLLVLISLSIFLTMVFIVYWYKRYLFARNGSNYPQFPPVVPVREPQFELQLPTRRNTNDGRGRGVGRGLTGNPFYDDIMVDDEPYEANELRTVTPLPVNTRGDLTNPRLTSQFNDNDHYRQHRIRISQRQSRNSNYDESTFSRQIRISGAGGAGSPIPYNSKSSTYIRETDPPSYAEATSGTSLHTNHM